MSSTSPALCPECGAEVRDAEATCWLCGRLSTTKRDQLREPKVASLKAVHDDRRFAYSLSTMLLIVTLVTVCCGLVALAPGLGILVGLAIVPVLLRTRMVEQRREAAGRTTSRATRLAMMAESFGAKCTVAALLAGAAAAAFFVVCACEVPVVINLEDQLSETWPVIIAIFTLPTLAAAWAAWLIGRRLWKWVRGRFERDISRD